MHSLVPPVSIVVTTKNLYPFTRFLLETVTWTLSESAYDVIIVDNGSTDETLSLARHYTFIENSEAGLYRSWNLGVRAAQHEYIVIANNDIAFCSGDWWTWLHAALTETNLEWVWPQTVEGQAPIPHLRACLASAERYSLLRTRPRIGLIEAACFAVHRSLFDEIGPFDEDFDIWYGEKDFEIRLLGASIAYGQVDNAVIRHFKSSSLTLELDDRDFEFDLPRDPGLQTRARQDYRRFCSKYQNVDLARLGLRFPAFGRVDLKDVSKDT